jgi:hypothetical protein
VHISILYTVIHSTDFYPSLIKTLTIPKKQTNTNSVNKIIKFIDFYFLLFALAIFVSLLTTVMNSIFRSSKPKLVHIDLNRHGRKHHTHLENSPNLLRIIHLNRIYRYLHSSTRRLWRKNLREQYA